MGPLLTSTETFPTGGAETQIFLLARELARRGLRASLLVFDLPGVAMPSSVDGVAVSVRPPYRAHERFGKLREAINLARAVVTADAENIVTRVASPEVGLAGLFAKGARRRFVYSTANISDFDLSHVEPKRRNRHLFRLGIRLADEIVVQTAEQARLCQERFGRSAVLIRSIAEPAPQREHQPEAFLWIGRLISYKQPLVFLELARALPEAKFWMIAVASERTRGGTELAAALEATAPAIPNLELLSPCPRRELMDLVSRAVAIVNTSEYEGTPNVFLEGWARGVPALALTRDPDDAIQRHGLGGFAHGSTERLLELSRRLWEDRGDQADVAARCRRYVADYHSPEAVGARWQEVLGMAPAADVAGAALAQ